MEVSEDEVGEISQKIEQKEKEKIEKQTKKINKIKVDQRSVQ